MDCERNQELLRLLHREVKPALGCTEPIAVALAVAKAVEIIQNNCKSLCPEGWRLTADLHIDVSVSGNILKNGMGVGIPGTGMVGPSPRPWAPSAGMPPATWRYSPACPMRRSDAPRNWSPGRPSASAWRPRSACSM